MTEEKKEKSNALRYILLFIVFFLIGAGIGYIGARSYLASRDKTEDKSNANNDANDTDILKDEKYSDTVDRLNKILSSSPLFYNTQGLSIDTIDEETKFTLTFEYLFKNDKATLSSLITNAGNTCNSVYVANMNDDGSFGSQCNIYYVSVDDINQFVSDTLNSTVNLKEVEVANNYYCALEDNKYTCGVSANNYYVGSLEPHFDTERMVLKDNGDIVVYNKGYLVDTRSNRVNGGSNNYLHSSDSLDYYYELKSSSNIEFKHTFKKNSNGSYYYYSSEVNK